MAIIRVDSDNGNDGNDGSTWALAKKTIASAITASVDGDEIWCANTADYTPAATLSLKDGTALYGGFVGTETSRNKRNPETNVTVITAAIALLVGNGNGMLPSWLVDGFTLQGYTSIGIGFDSQGQVNVSNMIIDGENRSVGGMSLESLNRVEYNDDNNQLSKWYSIYGFIKGTNTDADGKIYVNIVDDGGGFFHVDIYMDSGRTALVAHTATYNGTGSKVLTADNDSDIRGLIQVDAVVAEDLDIYVKIFGREAIFTNCMVKRNQSRGAYFASSGDADFVSCTFDSNKGTTGGGYYAEPATLNFTDCILSSNEASTGHGGAGFNDGAEVRHTRTKFLNNKAAVTSGAIGDGGPSVNTQYVDCLWRENVAGTSGGAIQASSGAYPDFLGKCRFVANKCNGWGGAIYFYSQFLGSGVSELTNCEFIGNEAGFEVGDDCNGGAMAIYRSRPIFTNCTFARNKASGFGGAVYAQRVDTLPTFKNCILWDNEAGNDGDEIYEYDSADVTVDYTDIKGGWNGSGGTGILNTDPMFANPRGIYYAAGAEGESDELADVHLQSRYGRYAPTGWINDGMTSPCIDAGDDGDTYANEPAPNGTRINMGAFGNTTEASKTLVVTLEEIYNRLGAPAAASVSADIAVIDANVDAILLDTGTDGVIVNDFTTAAKALLQTEAADALTAYDPPTDAEMLAAFAATNAALVIINANVEIARDWVRADEKIDTTKTPWEAVSYEIGTLNELGRKALKQPDGTDVTATTEVIGEATDV